MGFTRTGLSGAAGGRAGSGQFAARATGAIRGGLSPRGNRGDGDGCHAVCGEDSFSLETEVSR